MTSTPKVSLLEATGDSRDVTLRALAR